MIDWPNIPDSRAAILRQYDLDRDVLAKVFGRLTRRLTKERFVLVLKSLGISESPTVFPSHPRLRAAAYDYAVLAHRRRGRTIFQEWLDKYNDGRCGPTTPALNRVVTALTESRFGVHDIETVEDGVGVGVRDVLSGERHFVVDRLMSANWKAGARFGNRLIAFPGFAMFTSEPIEAAVSPGEDFQGGALSASDQAKLQAALIKAFAQAVRP